MEVILKSGKAVTVKSVLELPYPNRLYLWMTGMPISAAAQIFEDPENLQKIKSGEDVYEGFTHLQGAAEDGNAVKITLRKE